MKIPCRWAEDMEGLMPGGTQGSVVGQRDKKQQIKRLHAVTCHRATVKQGRDEESDCRGTTGWEKN